MRPSQCVEWLRTSRAIGRRLRVAARCVCVRRLRVCRLRMAGRVGDVRLCAHAPTATDGRHESRGSADDPRVAPTIRDKVTP